MIRVRHTIPLMHLLQALRNQAAQITAEIENSKLFTQMADRGTYRETVITKFLRPFLPKCYGLSTGEVFSADGAQSAQIDIVVYDDVFSTVLFQNNPAQLFPAESVFGAIEVKSNLTSAQLDEACENSRRLKQRQRAPSDMLDLSPLVRLPVGDGLGYDQRLRNPYLVCVFGYRGPSALTTANNLNHRLQTNPANKNFLPDFVFVANPGYMVVRCNSLAPFPIVFPGADFDQFAHLDIGNDALPVFFLTLNLCLSQLRLRALDHSALWLNLLRQLAPSRPANPS